MKPDAKDPSPVPGLQSAPAAPVEPRGADLHDVLMRMGELDASDVHLVVGERPRCRIHGNLVVANAEAPTKKSMDHLLEKVMLPKQLAVLAERGETDVVYSPTPELRFRITAFREAAGTGITARKIRRDVPVFESLNLPPIVQSFADYPGGLVILAGPSGSGRTTTLHSIIERVNESRHCHIVTIEDPAEFVHVDKRSLIHQREYLTHVPSRELAIEHAMWQSPDIIAVEDLVDERAISAALFAAESGILILATMQANTTLQVLDKLLHAFPGAHAPNGRLRLSGCLRAVLVQHLARKQFGSGSLPVTEVLVSTESVVGAIREDRQGEVLNAMMRCRSLGMRLLDDSLQEMVEQNLIGSEEALSLAVDKQRFETAAARSPAAMRGGGMPPR